jgi:hypothetical protein
MTHRISMTESADFGEKEADVSAVNATRQNAPNLKSTI